MFENSRSLILHESDVLVEAVIITEPMNLSGSEINLAILLVATGNLTRNFALQMTNISCQFFSVNNNYKWPAG